MPPSPGLMHISHSVLWGCPIPGASHHYYCVVSAFNVPSHGFAPPIAPQLDCLLFPCHLFHWISFKDDCFARKFSSIIHPASVSSPYRDCSSISPITDKNVFLFFGKICLCCGQIQLLFFFWSQHYFLAQIENFGQEAGACTFWRTDASIWLCVSSETKTSRCILPSTNPCQFSLFKQCPRFSLRYTAGLQLAESLPLVWTNLSHSLITFKALSKLLCSPS